MPLIYLILVLLVGAFFRLPPALFTVDSGALRSLAILHPNPKWQQMGLVGPDEELYRGYVDQLGEKGVTRYPEIVRGYIEEQTKLSDSILPPLRFMSIFAGYLWHSVLHADALGSLKNVASLFSVLTLILGAILVWRMRGPRWSVALAALVAFAPMQIHMSQHALVDSFLAFGYSSHCGCCGKI